MKSFFVIVSLFIQSLTSFAGAKDVKPKSMIQGDTYVRVTPLGEWIAFEKCSYGNENKKEGCTGIAKKFYRESDLAEKANWKWLKVGGALIGDAAFIVVAAYGCAFGASELAPGVLASPGYARAGFYMGGAGAGATELTGVITMINPAEQYRRGEVIGDDVRADKDVRVENIDEFIDRLTTVLEELDGADKWEA